MTAKICLKCGLLGSENPDIFGELKDSNICPVCGAPWIDIRNDEKYKKEHKKWMKKHKKDTDLQTKWVEYYTGQPLDPELVAKREAYNKRIIEYITSGKSLDDYHAKKMEKAVHEAENKLETNPTPPAPVVTCPYCHSTNTKKISAGHRWLSTGLFGLASSDLGKQWKCMDCGSKF